MSGDGVWPRASRKALQAAAANAEGPRQNRVRHFNSQLLIVVGAELGRGKGPMSPDHPFLATRPPPLLVCPVSVHTMRCAIHFYYLSCLSPLPLLAS